MATDDLSAPLGLDRPRSPRRSFPTAISHGLIGVLGLFVLAVAGSAMIADNRFGGEPVAVAPASPSAYGTAKRPGDPAPAVVAETSASSGPGRHDGPATEAAPPPAAGKTITIIDGSSGKRQEIVLPVQMSEGR